MKKIALLISAVFILAFLFGCGTEKAEPLEEATVTVKEEEMNTNEKTEIDTGLVTKEDIMEYFDFSEEELDGIDVEGVIKHENLLKENMEDFFTSRESCLEYFQICNEIIKTDISYLFKGGQPDGEIPVSQIKTVAFVVGENDASWYWQIRVQEKKAYIRLGYGDNMDLEKECDYSGAITDEYIAELLSCLEKANLHKWKAEYEGDDDGSTGSWGWRLGIELVDGTVYSWRGWGLIGDNKPKEYQSVEDVVESVYGKCPIKFNEDNEYAINFYR